MLRALKAWYQGPFGPSEPRWYPYAMRTEKLVPTFGQNPQINQQNQTRLEPRFRAEARKRGMVTIDSEPDFYAGKPAVPRQIDEDSRPLTRSTCLGE